MSMIDRFHASFNASYEKILGKYKNSVEKVVRKPKLIILVVILGIAALVLTMSTTKTGLVPDEDTGTLFCTV